MNYVERLKEAKEKVIKELNEKELIMIKYLSNHPKDHYLFLVLAKDMRGTFITWEYNFDGSGLFSGHYDIPDIATAMEDIKKREHYIPDIAKYEGCSNDAFFVQEWNHTL